jgi:hypothetical protein
LLDESQFLFEHFENVSIIFCHGVVLHFYLTSARRAASPLLHAGEFWVFDAISQGATPMPDEIAELCQVQLGATSSHSVETFAASAQNFATGIGPVLSKGLSNLPLAIGMCLALMMTETTFE